MSVREDFPQTVISGAQLWGFEHRNQLLVNKPICLGIAANQMKVV